MKMASMRIITNDVEKLTSFYEVISGLEATRYTPVFAELRTPSFTLAIGGTATLVLFNAEKIMAPAQNKTVIIEFRVEDVDKEFERLKTRIVDFVQEPTLMPWETNLVSSRTLTVISSTSSPPPRPRRFNGANE